MIYAKNLKKSNDGVKFMPSKFSENLALKYGDFSLPLFLNRIVVSGFQNGGASCL